MKNTGLQKIKEKLHGFSLNVIPYCHADFAWTHPRSWHVERYKQIIDEVLDTMNENPSYKWMADNIFPILATYLSNESRRSMELLERIREGRIEVTNGIMVLLRPTMAGDETFIRNITLGVDYLKQLIPDFNSDVFHNVDVSIGHSQLPQLLKLGGYKYYRGWRPQGAMDAKGIPRQFIWQGADGSSIICSRGTYAGLWKTEYMSEKTFEEKTLLRFYSDEVEDILLHSKANTLWIPFGMDDTRPMMDFSDNPVNLDKFMEYFTKKTGASIGYSTALEYFKAISKTQLPVFKGTLDTCDVGYNISSKGDKGLWLFRTILDGLLVKAETLWTIASFKGANYPENDFNELWKVNLFIASHGTEFVFSQDYNELYNSAVNAVESVENLIKKAMIVLIGKYTAQYFIFNTLNWERSEIVSFPTSGKGFVPNIIPSDLNNKTSQYQYIYDNRGHLKEILAEVLIPALGYLPISSVEIHKETQSQKKFDLDRFEEIQTVDTGKIIVSFKKGKILTINGSDTDSFGKISFIEMDQTPKDSWLYNFNHGKSHEFKPTDWYWDEFGPLRWKYSVNGSVGPHKATLEIILLKNKPDIDFNLFLESKEKSCGFFTTSFPTDSDSVFTADIPFGIEKRDMKEEPFGILTKIDIDNLERLWNNLFYARSWINYQVNGLDISIIGTRSPKYYMCDSATNKVSIILTRLYDLSLCEDWMKDTHPFFENPGKMTFSYSAIVRKAAKTNTLLPIIIRSKEKQLPVEIHAPQTLKTDTENCEPVSFINIQSSSSVISALYMQNGKTILRIYNASESEDDIKIILAENIVSFEAVDFLQNGFTRQHPISRLNGKGIYTKMNPWEILNLAFILTPEK